MKTPDAVAWFTATNQIRPYVDDADVTSDVVFGRVELAGKVIEHETGYRAERARIAELIPTTTDAGLTHALARRLELPLGPLGTRLRSSARCRRWRRADRTAFIWASATACD